ncbi:hypothetical protein D1224_12995 [Henriciella barbarensis]|jgi:hypothetical protein|uniref:Uncharacterized protein n=2 Tax=Henriciella TaxID=453849 RepID=A0A399QTZ8_9PROT|nr:MULTISPECIES: hypothetical protein [Henriciella]MCZ4298219.1 hypothetical protein [Henriciella marina]RIJ21665.1 hypothetical protein D1224_12995 [Henriciella barbarensis]HIG21833.1 hypothetical protein [Henriciella sp.]HIL18297.1 hypothetical protein [Gammaproteobacteria bacterium]|tara:strand:+ start:193 stop:633 length:441 start_codon:yes stop_codon:yes gene_type:complete
MSKLTEFEKAAVPGVMRRRDIQVIFVDAVYEDGLIMSALSAYGIPYLEVHDEAGEFAIAPTLDSILNDKQTVWETSRRQILIKGNVSSLGVSHLCLRTLSLGFEAFFCPTEFDESQLNSLILQRLLRAGVMPVPLEHLLSELIAEL